jgi:tetraacyldisaccharide 4'-kinase
LHEHYHALIRGEREGIWPACERLGLGLMSLPYGVAVRLRNWAFDHGWRNTVAVKVPVVSVGNLTAGGTGKTPCVEMIARCYRDLDRRVAILSRGYGAAASMNDEALVLEQYLPDVPHLQGADRAALAQVAVEELESEILILDDGFQHRRLRRDLDLVLIDATDPWGHGHLLPRGLLREPISGLRRADVVMLTRCDLVPAETVAAIRQRVERVAPNLPVVESVHEPAAWQNGTGAEQAVDGLHGRPIAAFCGIGNPDGFRRTLEKLGLNVTAWRTFADHHAYTRDDVEDLRRWARQQPANAAIVTTQKDLVKIGLERLGECELWALRIRLRVIAGDEVLRERLKTVFHGEPGV